MIRRIVPTDRCQSGCNSSRWGGIPAAATASVAWPALMAEGVPLFQVDGLGDLAPLAAAAPPGAPDLPEGDIIALGDEVGVIMIIFIIIIILLLLLVLL